jgi:KDO2-lipid IV(A) lauroyltransferase
LRKPTHPRYWPLWLALGLLRLLNHLPYTTQMKWGRKLGRLMLPLSTKMRHIAEVNLQLCFPEKTPAEREQLLQKNFESAGMTFFETGLAWWGNDKKFDSLLRVHGREHLERALQKGKGVIFCSAHFMCLELCGRLLSKELSFSVMYRPQKNPVLDLLVKRARKRYYESTIAREDLRGMLRALKKNTIVWYSADIDAGEKNSVFVPFFGVPAATITATSRLAKISGAEIVPVFFYRRHDDSGYDLYIDPALQNYPTDDEKQDALRMNQIIEQAVLKKPEEYLWQYRRFKTRPHGEPRFYQVTSLRNNRSTAE